MQLVPSFGLIPGVKHGLSVLLVVAGGVLAVLAVRRWKQVQDAMRAEADLSASRLPVGLAVIMPAVTALLLQIILEPASAEMAEKPGLQIESAHLSWSEPRSACWPSPACCCFAPTTHCRKDGPHWRLCPSCWRSSSWGSPDPAAASPWEPARAAGRWLGHQRRQ